MVAFSAAGDPQYVPKTKGAFVRGASRVQHWIGEGEFPVESGRYHLFINFLCGWSHRVMMVRAIKGLEKCVSMSHTGLDFVRKPEGYRGWSVPSDPTGNGFETTHDVYNSNNPDYGETQLSVPILFDKKLKKVVNNDSASICIILAGALDQFAERPELDLYPEPLREAIEEVNGLLYANVQDGVYRCGFARTEEAHEEARTNLYSALDALERSLDGGGRWLVGDRFTLADLRAFPHHFRFDAIYHPLFLRGRGKTLEADYPNVAAHVRRVYDEIPGVRATCDLHLATLGYASLPSKDKRLSPENADAVFRAQKWSWYPDVPDLLENRAREHLAPDYPLGYCTGYAPA